MAIIKCKMCGGDLVIEPGSTVAECEFCGSKQTIPNQDDDKKLTLFARANRLRMGSEFDKAAGIYESIVADFPEEAEAYWGLVLCKYGIEYVDDPASGKKIPTCHRSSFDSVMDDKDFEQACENADGAARKVYRDEAKAIEEIRKGIIEVSGKEEPYDIFICYKETAENGDRTIDSVIAQDVYDALTAKGYRVFFSRITLEDKLGQEYEPYIFAALNSAKIMLAFGTDYEYYNAVWVKNEWSRYLKLMAKDKSKHLIPCYKNIDAYDMPKEFAKLQAQDMGKIGAMQDLLRGIEKVLGGRKKETVPAAAPVQQVIQQVVGGTNVNSLLDRGYMSLEDGAFDEAKSFFNDALNSNSKCAEAYLGLFMVEIKAKNKSQAERIFVVGIPPKCDICGGIMAFEPDSGVWKCGDCKSEKASSSLDTFINNRFYQRAKQFAEGVLKAELAEWEKKHTAHLSEQAKAVERAEQECRAAAEEQEKKRRQEITSIFEQLKIGVLPLSNEQKEEQSRLDSEAERTADIAQKAKSDYIAMPEHAEKSSVEKEIDAKRTYLAELGIFKGKEKKQVQAQITALEGKLYSIAEKLEVAKKNVENLNVTARSHASAASAYKNQASIDTREKLRKKLLELIGLRQLTNGNVTFGTYPQTEAGDDKTPIEWRVLAKEGSRMLLISDKGLDAVPYNMEYTDTSWSQCTLRTWLNNEFVNTAFVTNEERELIPNVTVTVDKNPKCDTNPDSNTQDKVFLLSIDEVNRYFGSDSVQQCQPTDYAEKNGAYVDSGGRGCGNCYWWLRSPGNSNQKAANILTGGSIFDRGTRVDFAYTCVRPAMWLNLDLVP